METVNKDSEVYGIKYKVIGLEDNIYLLYPVDLVKGRRYDNCFKTDKEIISYAENKDDFESKFVVDLIHTKEELEKIYKYEGDEEFLSNFFFEDYRNDVYIVNVEEEGCVTKVSFDFRKIADQSCDAVYCMDESYPAAILNEKALDKIIDCSDDRERSVLIENYRSELKNFKILYDCEKVNKVYVTNGKVNYFETLKELNKKDIRKEVEIATKSKEKEDEFVVDENGVSYKGLKKYLEERIYGHDEEIAMIAQKLYMNYTAIGNEPTQSILMVGPTGTGKTQTVHSASEYLNIPFVEMNVANMVPQGIKGPNLDDLLIRLYELSGRDINKAEKGIVFLDEFDKMDEITDEFREGVKNSLLTFNDGGKIIIEQTNYSFTYDAGRTTKMYAGVFQKISDKVRSMGFNAELEKEMELTSEQIIRKAIVDKKYFTDEQLSRIGKILGYGELDREAKKKALLGSKTGEFSIKKARYKRQFGIDIVASEEYIDAILETLDKDACGMRNLNNYIGNIMDGVERKILEEEIPSGKQLVLNRNTVFNPEVFDIN